MNTVNLNEEKSLWENGYNFIAGIDEVGRGPLAGPVVISAVVFPKFTKFIKNINDSKKLTKRQREKYFYIIRTIAKDIAVVIIDEKTIDLINIYQATILGMKCCLDLLNPGPEFVLVDGMSFIHQNFSIKKIIKGDEKVMSIAAASIIAKVTRDNIMEHYHESYPEYKFNKNVGYPTKYHIEAIKQFGESNIHRKSFKVKQLNYNDKSSK